MENLSLNGQWKLRQVGKKKVYPAQVSGQVHLDLMAAGEIEDPFYRDNENSLQWIGDQRWEYSRTFNLSHSILQKEKIILRCEGIDTLATVQINDKTVAKTDNMYRVWEFDIKSYLKSGRNSITVQFAPPMPYIEKRMKKRHIPSWGSKREPKGRAYLRKEPCNFGWDWGPVLVTCGIWRNIEILAWDLDRITAIRIDQHHHSKRKVGIDVYYSLDRVSRGTIKSEIRISHAGCLINSSEKSLAGKKGLFRVTINNPKLWWPAGMGGQPLYEVELRILDAEGNCLDVKRKRIGLRKLQLIRKPDRWGESFYFEANGIPFFAKGANWIPSDAFVCRMTPEKYRHLLQSSVDVHMNMLRVWGGGIYEQDVFYDICDELGITIWQDFMFACSTYPTFDKAFLASVKAEVRDNIERLRHHPCIALWCGNNELEMGLVSKNWTDRSMSWKDYGRLFDNLLPQCVKQLDPQRDYWPSSPHSSKGDREDSNNSGSGDAHLWDVWHKRKPFEHYRTHKHRFCSEFGFQSFPEPQTVKSYTLPEDRNVTSFVMEHHQRSDIGNTVILQYMLHWFLAPKNFESTLWLSQILQGLGIKYAVEHWRRNMPRCMGALYWQLNDCWPVASWASIDYAGRWKALHYLAKRFFAPLLISGVEDKEKGTVVIHLTSDLPNPINAVAKWTLTTAEGSKLKSGKLPVKIGARRSKKIKTLYFAEEIERYGERNLLVWLELLVDGQVESRNLVSFVTYKHLKLAQPKITTRLESKTDGSFNLHLTTDRAAIAVWVDLRRIKAKLSDNFINLNAYENFTIIVQPEKPVTKEQLAKALKVYNLTDTCE